MASKKIFLTLQGMEERAVPATLLNGNLNIVGTPTNDTVDVRRVDTANGDMIQVNQDGNYQYFTPSQVHLVKFWGLDGDDSFVYSGSKDVVAMGGAGSDTLISGGGNDKLHGGSGHDLLRGHDGNDILLGDAGNDWLSGGDGNDKLHGDKGNDVLLGGDGNDVLRGGAGKDVAFGGNGNDQFYGLAQDTGSLSAPISTPYGTAYFYGIQDFDSNQDRIWS